MKILNVSNNDWANFAYTNAAALRSVGLHCDSVTMQSHPFYTEQSEVIPTIRELLIKIEQYDVIQFFHDNMGLFNLLLPFSKDKRVIAYHTSSEYRKNHTNVNATMKYSVTHHVCAMPEFMAHFQTKDKEGNITWQDPNVTYMVGAVDTDTILPGEYTYNGGVFGHYPSNPTVKGTEKILEVLRSVPGIEFVYNNTGSSLPHKTQLLLMDGCDFYIELLSDVDGNGQPYGNFGITALEAAALGKIVITQCRNIDVYLAAYGDCALNLAKDSDKLRRHVVAFSNYNGDHLAGQKQAVRDWVVRHHSYSATGEYWKKHILPCLQ